MSLLETVLGRWRRGRGRRFVVVFPGRTGSSWLRDALERHPRVAMRGEMLVGLDAAAQRRAVAQVFGRVRAGRAAGFKTKLKDVADPAFLAEMIERYDATVVRMRREDLLRLALSRINARRLHDAAGRWNAGEGVEPVEARAIEPEVLREALESARGEVDRVEAFVRRLDRPVVEVAYHEILQDPTAVLHRIQSVLGVRARALESRVVKNTTEDLAEAVPNLDEVVAAFEGGEWSRVFQVDRRVEGPAITDHDDEG